MNFVENCLMFHVCAQPSNFTLSIVVSCEFFSKLSQSFGLVYKAELVFESIACVIKSLESVF